MRGPRADVATVERDAVATKEVGLEEEAIGLTQQADVDARPAADRGHLWDVLAGGRPPRRSEQGPRLCGRDRP